MWCGHDQARGVKQCFPNKRGHGARDGPSPLKSILLGSTSFDRPAGARSCERDPRIAVRRQGRWLTTVFAEHYGDPLTPVASTWLCRSAVSASAWSRPSSNHQGDPRDHGIGLGAFIGQAVSAEDDGARSKGSPASTQASIPPRSGRMCLNPACLRCLAATAADTSFGHAQYTTISAS
jgi:hypothetical protein